MVDKAMDSILAAVGVMRPSKTFLRQWGVKGMQWGVRKSRSAGPGPASGVDKKLVTIKRASGGDASSAAKPEKSPKPIKTKKPKPPPAKDFDDKELQAIINRMTMEKRYAELTAPAPNKAAVMIGTALNRYGQEQLNSLVSNVGNAAVGAATSAIIGKVAAQGGSSAQSQQVLNLLKTMSGTK